MTRTKRSAALATVVRSSRLKQHLTQAQLAKRAGVSRSEISEIEAGRIASPRAAVFVRLAGALKVPAALLLTTSGYALGEGTGEVDPEELAVFASSLVTMAGADRPWLREKLVEIRDLLLLRRGAPRRLPGGTRPGAS